MNVALYARHSSDLQNPCSTADQVAALRLVAEARGAKRITVFTDKGLTGANLFRPGLQGLLAGAERQGL